jgi:hypothetical protein
MSPPRWRKFRLEDKRDYTVVEAPSAMRACRGKEGRHRPGRAAVLADPELRRIARTLFAA